MSFFKSKISRPGARSLDDVKIDDSVWKADFDIVDRYQCLGSELMRISLLGLAAFGFLIKEVIKPCNHLQEPCSTFMLCASLLIVACIISVLFHRFKSTECLDCQILIMRGLKRLENDHWSETEKQEERLFIDKTRKKQMQIKSVSHYILILAAVCFTLALFFIVLVCHNALIG